jgi:hypothetical protein
MAGVVRDWRVELVKAYPDLFHPLPDSPGVAQASPECGAGWRNLLERACARIRAAVQADGGSFKATQIKEKYATLRFYWEGALSPKADAQVDEIIDLAEARSACTCEVCGEEGRLYQSGYWMMTRCALHAEGRAVVIEPSFENVHVKERIVGERREIVCRRYDRETDSFIVIDAGSLGIEEE